MFVCASILVLAIATGVIASPSGTKRADSCSTGAMQCCNQITSASNAPAGIVDLLGLDNLVGPIGLGCTPITAIGTGSGADCTSQAVCCTNTQEVSNQLVGVNCSPVNLNL
ncbi:type 1 hydrophobin [Imleria badia]|nr:type 1 hydrophobin [Imleria badia]